MFSTMRLQMAFIAILLLSIAIPSVEGGAFYYRWASKKLVPSASSGLATLSTYLLSTISSVNEASQCSVECNSVANCRSAQYQISLKKCLLYSVSELSQIAVLATDTDYVTFSVNSQSVASKSSQIMSANNITTYQFKSTLLASKTPLCWDPSSGSAVHAEELGVRSDNLHDLAFSSSSWTTGSPAPMFETFMFARIDNPPMFFCWKQYPSLNEWIKIDLQQYSYVTRIWYESNAIHYWQTLRLEYSYDDVYFNVYKSATQLTKYFDGAASSSFVKVAVDLDRPLFTRYLRFHGAVESNPSTYHCMKFAIEGCPDHCAQPLGISTLEVEDSWLQSDGTSNEPLHLPNAARLLWTQYGFRSRAMQFNSQSNLVIDLFRPTLVKGVQIQGCSIYNAWVTSFRVMYKLRANDEWTTVNVDSGENLFSGNTDSTSVVAAFFQDGVVNGQFFNIVPRGISTYLCYKVELVGCKKTPIYLDNLASEMTVSATAQDSGVLNNLPISSATQYRKLRANTYQNCTHVPASSGARPMLTIDLGSTKTITSVEITTPSVDPSVALNPDGLWLFDVLHGGDDLSGNGNHAIIGQYITYGDGVDGRKMGALNFPNNGKRPTVMIPVRNIGPDYRNGWSVFTWIYIDPVQSTLSDFSVFSFYINDYQWGFNFIIRTTGSMHNNFVLGPSWGMEDHTVPFGRWVFIGFVLDCKSGVARQIVDKRASSKRYYDCPASSTVIPFGQYAMLGWMGAFVGRISCMQVYRRALDQSEIEQASLCPWLPPAPKYLFPFDCSSSDILGSGISFTAIGSPSCTTQKSFPASAWSLGANTDGFYLTNGNNGPMDLRYSFTMTVMVYSTTPGNIFYWYSDASNIYNSREMRFQDSGGNGSVSMFRFIAECRGSVLFANDLLYEVNNIHIRLRTWTYYGIQYDHARQVTNLLFEGEVIKSVAVNCPNGLNTGLTGFAVGNSQFAGSIACLQVYNQVLTRKQLHSVRRCPITSNSQMNAVFSYPIDGEFGREAPTNAGPSNPILSQGGAYWHSSFPWSTRHYTYGFAGNTGNFLSNSTMPGAWLFQSPTIPYTIGLFALNEDASGTNKGLLNLLGSGGAKLNLWQNPSDGSIYGNYACTGGTASVTSSTGAAPANIWAHNMITVNPSTGGHKMAMYVDGNQVASASYGWNCDPIDTTQLVVATDLVANSFHGAVTCLVAFPGFMDQLQAQEMATCPTPVKLEGHACDSDLLGVGLATITFSSVYTSPAGVPFNSYWSGTDWVGSANTAGSTSCCWQPSAFSTSEWIQADLLEEKQIYLIETQGDPSTGYYVKTFQISTSNDGREFALFMNRANPGSAKTFVANTDSATRIYNILRPTIKTRFVRLIPQTWNTGIGLRWTVRGCPTMLCNAELFDASARVVASSAANTYNAYRAGIDATFDWSFAGASSDPQPFFQLIFDEFKIVTASVIQSSKSANARITKYHLLYSLDAINWQVYTWANNGSTVRILDGPASAPDSLPLVNTLQPPFAAKSVRVVVDDWYSSATGRFGFKGCKYLGETDYPLPSFKVRIGSSAPANAAAADSQSQCGVTLPMSGVPFNSKITLPCQSPTSGRYISIVGQYEGTDMTLCQVAAYNEAASNFASLKPVTASSDITAADALLLTDGSLTSGSMGTSSSSMWLRVDLGYRLPVSKVVLVTHTSGWQYYPTYSIQPIGKTCDQGPVTVFLDCPDGQVIFTEGYSFGRTDTSYCNAANPTSQCAGYNYPSAVNQVRNLCDMKNNCTVIHNFVGGDPCGGISKFAETTYLCIDSGDISPKLVVRVGDDGATISNNFICDYQRLDQVEMIPGSSLTFNCLPPIIGRYITIEKKSTMMMKFAEIFVY